MKILSATQFYEWDRATIDAQDITSLDLMERAAKACAQEIVLHYQRSTMFVILCGMGNNGGDGLALTRLLHQKGYAVRAVIVHHRNEYSDNAHANLEQLFQIQPNLIAHLNEGYYIQDIAEDIVIIDAILGIGLKQPLKGWLQEVVAQLNRLPNEKIAIDIPTGLMADEAPIAEQQVLAVDHTFTFQMYKRVMLHPEADSYLGQVQLLNIGLDNQFLDTAFSPYNLLTLDDVKSLVQPIPRFAHKGTKGTAAIAAGSEGMAGAALLSCRAALRTGAGKVIAQTPECNILPIQVGVPEVIVQCNGKKYQQRISTDRHQALAIGPGIGTDEVVCDAVRNCLEQATEPLVLDADALNIIALENKLLYKIPKHSILTPHVKEFERLFGTSKNSMCRLEAARTQAMKYNFFIIIKGHFTQIVSPDGQVFYNTVGHEGLATAGSGDVLTGIIVGLLAQHYEPIDATKLGVFLHGLAGDEVQKKLGMRGMIASDIIRYLPIAWQKLAA